MYKFIIAVIVSFAVSLMAHDSEAAKKPSFEGYKKCGGCHKSQKESWLETEHASAFDLLKPGEHAKDKKKAKLDPDKDYTKDEKCIGCHVTGYKKKGGYREGLSKTRQKYLLGVGCEECHGPGSLYRKEHRKAGSKFKKTRESSPRKTLVKTGQIFDYEEACNGCHMNYKGSPWKGAKEPYTPFTPDVDPEYKFDFEKAVREMGKDEGMHEHFKLRGVYEGEPLPRIREEFQKKAKEPAEGEEEDEGDDGEADDEK